MERPILPDSSWYINLLRLKRDPLLELATVSEERDILICGMVIAEVGRGIRDPFVLKRYVAAWSLMSCIRKGEDLWRGRSFQTVVGIGSEMKLWDETMKLAWRLDRSGVILPIQDIHIACCALEVGAMVITFDKHFSMIPELDTSDRVC